MWSTKLPTAIAGSVLLSLGACGTMGTGARAPGPSTSAASNPAVASGYGVVQSIDMVSRENSGIGVGAVAGAVVGGILGNQIGQGRGNTAATVAGAAGGAMAGHQLEKNTQQNAPVYRVALRMDNGSVQTVVQETQPNVRIGDRVQVSNGMIAQPY
jgi:outer membrane lipoprotein SlyB